MACPPGVPSTQIGTCAWTLKQPLLLLLPCFSLFSVISKFYFLEPCGHKVNYELGKLSLLEGYIHLRVCKNDVSNGY